MEKTAFLMNVEGWYSKSAADRSLYDQRWAKNLRIIKGIFEPNETLISKTRGRAKINYRKVEAITWRIVADLYRTFLSEKEPFDINGRMDEDDVHKAKVLQEVAFYHIDRLNRHDSLALKHMAAFKNIADLGLGVGKLWWNEDHPEYVLYPNEQVFADWNAVYPEKMKFVILVNYMCMKDMEEMKFKNLDKARPKGMKNEQLRNVRHQNTGDPATFGENEYPSPGKTGEDQVEISRKEYAVYETFFKKDGKVWLGYSSGSDVELKEPELSVYDHYPLMFGQCLFDPHKAIGTGFPEILEGPNESFNVTLNQRKDNVSLVLNPMTLVSRYANVDLDSLVNSRAAGITLTDDMGGVEDRKMPDVTQNAYMEAASDEAMMQELSGVTPAKQGLGSANQKATVANINEQNSNIKIGLFTAVISETYMKPFYHELLWQINRFETSKRVMRIANGSFKSKNPMKFDDVSKLADVEDFIDLEIDLTLRVGRSEFSKDQDLKKVLLAMEKAIMANQSQMQLLQSGLMPPEGIKMYNPSAFEDEILRLLDMKNIKDFVITIKGESKQPQQNQELAGQNAPQLLNKPDNVVDINAGQL